MKTRAPWNIKLAFRFCEHTHHDGFDIGIGSSSKEEHKLVHTKLIDALELIRQIDPRRYRYLQRDVRRIMVFEGRPVGMASMDRCPYPMEKQEATRADGSCRSATARNACCRSCRRVVTRHELSRCARYH